MYKEVPFVPFSRRLLLLVVFLVSIGYAVNIFAATSVVRIFDFGFQPNVSLISPGDSITWSNSAPLTPHDTTQRTNLWGSTALGFGGKFTFTFTTAGSYPYLCKTHQFSHPEQTGVVTVASANLPPTVSLVNPTNNQHFFAPATFTLQAKATDDVAVASVQFFSGANPLGSDLTSPYSLTVSNLGQNTYTFSAQAVDNQGARGTSAVVTVFVDNVPSVFIENVTMTNNVFSFRIRGGAAGQRADVQKSSGLNGDWTTISSAVFPPTDCPLCPFIDFVDNNPAPDRRFYKIQVFP